MTARECADELGISLDAFYKFAQRRALRPTRRERVGRSTYAIYDSDDLRHAVNGAPPTPAPSDVSG